MRARRYGTETVSHEVLQRMKQLMVDSASSSASHSFLLDDDSTIPFSQDDIAGLLDDKVGGGGDRVIQFTVSVRINNCILHARQHRGAAG